MSCCSGKIQPMTTKATTCPRCGSYSTTRSGTQICPKCKNIFLVRTQARIA